MKETKNIDPNTLIGKNITIPTQWCEKRLTKTSNFSGVITAVWVKPYSKHPSLNERRVGVWIRNAKGNFPIFLHGEKAFNYIIGNVQSVSV